MNSTISPDEFALLSSDGPYVDIGVLKEKELEAGFRLFVGERRGQTDKIDEMPPIDVATWKAAKKVCTYVQNHGIKFREVSGATGIDPALFSRMKKGKRGLSVSPKYLEPLCYGVMHQSCNAVLLGFPAEITLPGIANEIAIRMAQLPEDKTLKLRRIAEREYRKYKSSVIPDEKTGHYRDVDEMIRDRFEILTDGSGLSRVEIFGKETPVIIRQRLIKYLKSDSSMNTHIDFILYLACMMHGKIPTDFFVAEDMSPFVDFFYCNGNSRIQITDENIVEFFGKMFAVPKELRNKLLTMAVSQIANII